MERRRNQARNARTLEIEKRMWYIQWKKENAVKHQSLERMTACKTVEE